MDAASWNKMTVTERKAFISRDASMRTKQLLGGSGADDIGIRWNADYSAEQINEAMMGYEVKALRHRS